MSEAEREFVKATALANERQIGWMPGDFFVGTIVITGPANDDGDETDVPDSLVKQLVPTASEGQHRHGE